ncbi:capsid protein [Streptomyces sp.]|uniref:capsid protein n=1 Tax=Streptomyces sp. TaxID=1931 RepID=UPI002F958EE3
MPLPAGNTPWPPRELDPVTARLAVWSTWYSGDPDRLSEMYGGSLAGDPGQPMGLGGFLDPTRPGWRGRLGALAARWFWGVQTPQNERRTKLHLPLAGDIASTSADLLFSEPPTISVTSKTVTDGSSSTKSESSATQDRLNEFIDDGMHADLLESAEVCAGLGGVYLRVCWDKEVRDRPWLSAIHADAAIPEWRWGILRAATVWRVVATEGNIVRRHLERHEPGVILHGLYEGSADDLGKPIPLDADPATQGLQEKVDTLVDKLTITYIPNMRPARVWRDVPAGANLGRADFSGTEGLMDAADEAWSSWMRDIRIGKGRILVPDVYLNSDGKGQGATWESEREVYTSLAALPGPNTTGLAVMPQQFAIRVNEHRDTVNELVNAVVRSSGYSESDFGEAGVSARESAITATEVDSKRRRSNITRDRKTTYWRPGLADIVETLLAVDAAHFASGVEPEKPEIEFGDGVSVEPEALAQTAQLLRAAEAASTRTLVEMVHPDWEDDRIDAEVEAIKGEAPPEIVPGSAFGAGMEPGAGPGASDGNEDGSA